MKYTENKQFNIEGYKPSLITKEISNEVTKFHKSFDDYNETELVSLPNMSNRIGIKEFYVKDESKRFNLNAFKVLGAAYAVGKTLSRELGKDINELSFNELKKQVKENLSHIVLVATTDGNHGRGVAWIGKQLGLKVVIYMPKGTTQNRLDHILKLGGQGTITEMNYDDTVRWVAGEVEKNGWVMIQDTSWEGYEDVPLWIMQGYSTVVKEIVESLGDTLPTHVFLQAGVGAFAGIVAEIIYTTYGENCPKIVVVESNNADCFYQSAIKGEKVICEGELETMMAGLACGEPNPIGYEVLIRLSHSFISAPDFISANGMRILATPLGDDQAIISGESGAVTIGVVESAMMDSDYSDIKEQLGLDEESIVVTVSTEGDTDRGVYEEVVWYGRCSKINSLEG